MARTSRLLSRVFGLRDPPRRTAPRPRCASTSWDIRSLRLSHGYAGHLVDRDGVDYIDMVSSWGANLLGHGYPRVARAVASQIARYSNLGSGCPAHGELHRLLARHIPCAEAILVVKNGSDATAAAVRLARAVTRRERILHRGYHGVQDWFMATTSCAGIPEALRSCVDSLEALTVEHVARALRAHPREYACLVADPVASPIPDRETMLEIRELVRNDGGLLVYDEVVSGFRVAPGGMQQVWGVVPDLACFAKGIANGLPLAVLVGPEQWMRHVPSINYSLTFSCDAVSMVAAIETIREIVEKDVCSDLARKGGALKKAYAAACATRGISSRMAGHDSRPHLVFEPVNGLSEETLRYVALREMGRHGICCFGTFNLCFAHTEADVTASSRSLDGALDRVGAAIERGSVEGLLD